MAPPPEPYLIWKESADAARIPSAIDRTRLRRLLTWGAGITAAVILFPPIPMLLPFFWMLAVILGYASALLIALLMVLPLRNLTRSPFGRMPVPMHERLAIWCLALAALHALVFLAGEPMTIEYLKWSQPRYMIAGNAGIVLLALLVVTSLERYRPKLFGLRLRFRPFHVAGSILLTLLTVAHMLGSAIYVDGRVKMILLAVLCAAIVALSLRRPQAPPQSSARSPSQDPS